MEVIYKQSGCIAAVRSVTTFINTTNKTSVKISLIQTNAIQAKKARLWPCFRRNLCSTILRVNTVYGIKYYHNTNFTALYLLQTQHLSHSCTLTILP